MIPSIHKQGSNTAGAIAYLYRTGRGHEAHTDPHLVASSDGLAPDPARDPDATFKQLARYLDLPVEAVDPAERPDKHVWHCSVRTAPDDPILTDAQWADIARRIVHATGIAPEGDDAACRWIAVRHADDHIHILATKVRQDGTKPRDSFSYKHAQAEARKIEIDYGLRRVTPGDGTAAKRPTRAETEKAHRTGRSRHPANNSARSPAPSSPSPPAPRSTCTCWPAAASSSRPCASPPETSAATKSPSRATPTPQASPSGSPAPPLAPDLSYPQIRDRLTTTDPAPPADPRRPNPWHQATAATERIPYHLDQNDDPASQAHIAAFAEALDVLPLHAPKEIRPQLRQAATATSNVPAAPASTPTTSTPASSATPSAPSPANRPAATAPALAMLLDVAVLAVIAIQRWHSTRHHDQQVEAARRTLAHLQAAYDQTATAPLAALAHRAPAQPAADRHAHHIRQTIPAHADQILNDPHWPALATALADAETAGHNPTQLLQQAADQRALTDARSPAQVLTWRLHRLAQRPAPSPRARAAQARSTIPTRRTSATETAQPTQTQQPPSHPRHR